MNANDILTLKQISQQYDISYSRLTKATAAKLFPFFRQGKVFVKRSDFEAWLTSNRVESSEEIKQASKIAV